MSLRELAFKGTINIVNEIMNHWVGTNSRIQRLIYETSFSVEDATEIIRACEISMMNKDFGERFIAIKNAIQNAIINLEKRG